MGRKELGISSKEYNDSLVLEKLFYITKKVKCSTCMFKHPTAVDFHKLELLCDTCSSRCKTVSRIGFDDIHMRTILELERKYKITDNTSGKSNKKEKDNNYRANDNHKREKHRKGDKNSKKHSENRKNDNANFSISPVSPIDSDEETIPRNNSIYQMYDAPDKIPGMAGLMATKYQQSNPFKNFDSTCSQPTRTVSYNGYPCTYGYQDLPNIPVPHTDRQYTSYSKPQSYNIPQQYSVRLALPSEGGSKISKNPFAQDVFNNTSHQRYN